MPERSLPDGTTTAILCPKCKLAPPRLIVRTNRITGEQFLGCPNWPDCKHTQTIPESLRMRLMGAPQLPGF